MKRVVAVVVAALLLSGCGATISTAQATRSWVRQSNFFSNQRQMASIAEGVATALRRASTSATLLHTECSVLYAAVSQLNAALPTPDDQSTNQLGVAYTTIGDGANTCYNAAGRPQQRNQALQFLRTGLADLTFAVIRVRVAEGRGPG